MIEALKSRLNRNSNPVSGAVPSERDPSEFVDDLVGKTGGEQEQLIPILQAIQKHYRCLPEESLKRLSEITTITAADIMGVASFYSQFRLGSVGKHIIKVCHGTACHVRGSSLTELALRRELKIEDGSDTDPSNTFTMERVACLGCCTLAPVLQIEDITYASVTADRCLSTIEDFKSLPETRANSSADIYTVPNRPGLTEIRISIGSCCEAGGTLPVRDALLDAVEELGAPAIVKSVGCVSMCHHTPMVEVAPGDESDPVIYCGVTPEQAGEIVRKHFQPRGVMRSAKALADIFLERFLDNGAAKPVIRYAPNMRDGALCDFLGRQKRIATDGCGSLSPLDIEEYLRHDGFEALRRALFQFSPGDVISQVQLSGLRGRGGAGFQTGRKWEFVSAAPGSSKYLVCNGDEGDPGAFMDRMLMEEPYRLLEGMAIASYAVGAREGVLYIRAEYPRAVQAVRAAIIECERRGYLGDRILGTDHSLKLRVMEGAGAYVCGEETALIASIEGRRGVPALRPPYPAQSGLHGCPTLINNVETYSVIPWIIRNGAAAFAELGTGTSRGTKVFSLSGKVRRGGLVEVPMGVTIREIVEDIGGGVVPGRVFKAVQIGGPSGGCLPASLADTPIDYEALAATGAIMGSGGLVVLDDTDCMVDMARYFMKFLARESCGQCTMCRIGTQRMLDILERICAGKARRSDLLLLEELAPQVKLGSLCGLGQTAPNPVLTTLRYFRGEYEAHLQGRCPAGRCPSLIHYSINSRCIGCTLCAQECPTGAIEIRPFQEHSIDEALCIRCDGCRRVCPTDAVEVI